MKQGTLVVAVHASFIDTDMAALASAPKDSPESRTPRYKAALSPADQAGGVLVLGADPAEVPGDPAIFCRELREGRSDHGFIIVVVRAATAERTVEIGSPPAGGYQAGLHESEPIKKPRNVGPAARDERCVPVQLLGHAEQSLGRLRVGFVGHVGQGQITAGHYCVPKL